MSTDFTAIIVEAVKAAIMGIFLKFLINNNVKRVASTDEPEPTIHLLSTKQQTVLETSW